ncbi:MAG: alkaline phosphatase [Lewinellaceae bacterium]|nr:alkaline phosphatase [Lewinellaceae bacterium]
MKQRQFLLLSMAGLVLLFFSFHSSSPTVPPNPAPNNIILLVGDGMGLAQVSYLYVSSVDRVHFSRFQFNGLHINTPVGDRITDSAAGATAIATGSKTRNGAVGVNANGVPQQSLLELAALQEKRTGLIATTSITDATPAAFFAKVRNRKDQDSIALQFVHAPIDFAAAGGFQFFAKNKFQGNLLDSLRASGVNIDTLSLPAKSLDPSRRYVFLLGPDSLYHMVEKDRPGRGNFLPDATKLAIDYLAKGENGFFLLVEGSLIDWGCHNNDTLMVREELRDFNRAVGVALDFAERDGHTLVVVTGDHETGGFVLSPEKETRIQGMDTTVIYHKERIIPAFFTKEHTASLVPVFAYGPGAERFSGVYQNTELFEKLKWQ